MKPYPTLGLLYVSAYLRAPGSRSRSSTARSPTGTTCSTRFRAEPDGLVGIYTNLMTRPTGPGDRGRRQGRGLDGRARRPRGGQLPGRVPRSRRRRDRGRRGRADDGRADPRPVRPRRPPAPRPPRHGLPRRRRPDRHQPGARADRRHRRLPWPDRGRIDQARYVERLAPAPRHGQRQPDHRPWLPIQVPLVFARGLRLHPPRRSHPRLRRRAGVHPRHLSTRPGLVRRRRLHHQPPLALRVRGELDGAV